MRKANLSLVTGVFNGAPLSFQSGISSFKAIGSRQAPERMCVPISLAFSTKQTRISLLLSKANCFALIAADNPAGPPPT